MAWSTPGRAPRPPRGLKTPGRVWGGWADMGPGGSWGVGGEYLFPMVSPLADPTQDRGMGRGAGRSVVRAPPAPPPPPASRPVPLAEAAVTERARGGLLSVLFQAPSWRTG